MQKKMLLSIVIPIYNVQNYLNECLDSVKNYDESQIEIILIDDGSTDKSSKICESYIKNYTNTKYIRQENKGLSEARNVGIREAKGEYILFLDSDDYLYENILKKILDDLISNNLSNDIYLGRAYEFIDGEKKYKLCQIDYNLMENKSTPLDIFDKLNQDSNFWFAAWLIVIKRKFLLNNRLFFKVGIYHEDELWVPLVFMKASSIGFFNYGFYCYRKNRKDSIVSTPNIKREFDKLTIVEEFDKLNKFYNRKYDILSKRQAALIFGIILHIHEFKKNPNIKSLEEKIMKNICKLKYGKYKFVYYLIKILGIYNINKIITKFKLMN